MTDNTFGLDIGEKYTRICDLRKSGNQIEVTTLGFDKSAAIYGSTDNDKVIEDQAKVIADLYSKLRISKKNVNVVIPDAYTYSQIIEMPKLREKELLAAIRYQADEFIPMPIDETILDLEILKEDETKKKLLILIVASPKKLVNQIQKAVEMAHLVPETLENELSAVGRLIANTKVKKTGASIFVNFGYSSTSIYLVDNALSLITVVRTFKMGLDLFIKDLKVNLNWDDKKIEDLLVSVGIVQDASYNIESIIAPLLKELLNEIEKFMILAKERYNLPVENIFLFNLDNHINHLNEKIQKYFSIPAESFTLNAILKPTSLTQSYADKLSLFVSVISTAIR